MAARRSNRGVRRGHEREKEQLSPRRQHWARRNENKGAASFRRFLGRGGSGIRSRGDGVSLKARGGHANGFDGRGDISLRRPGLHIGKARASERTEASGIGSCVFQQFSKGVNVAAAENQLGRDGSDE